MDVVERLYDRDFVEWTEAQADALRRQKSSRPNDDAGIDYDNLIEEILDVGRSARRRHCALLTQLVAHLLKLEQSPAAEPRRHWMSEAATFRIDAKREAADAPSISGRIDLLDLFQDARRIAIDGMRIDGVDGRDIPLTCPYDLDTQILADGWFPENRCGVAP
jgi:hypothetical protein